MTRRRRSRAVAPATAPLAPRALQVGDVVEAAIHNYRERRDGSLAAKYAAGDPDAEKLRPAVWVKTSPMTGSHLLAGITTWSHYGNGIARAPLAFRSGRYDKPCYLWGGSLVWVTPQSVGPLLGHLSDEDMAAVAMVHAAELCELEIEVAS